MTIIRDFVLLSALSLITGCAQQQYASQPDKYSQLLETELNVLTVESVMNRWGNPEVREDLGDMEILTYVLPFGVYVPPYKQYENNSAVVDLAFKDGVLQTYYVCPAP